MRVSVRLGDLTEEKADALVNPANSYGSMGGGAALALKRAGGVVVEEEAIRAGPTPVGRAVATSAGRLSARFVIHAPTMELPAQGIEPENVERATYAALECASRLGLRSVAFPGMGTGVGGVGKKIAAGAMVKAIKRFSALGKPNPEEVTLVGFDSALYDAFLGCVKDAGL
jgi:O-acetyl-ADP-ribose deacetylase (regulator of RNase III)